MKLYNNYFRIFPSFLSNASESEKVGNLVYERELYEKILGKETYVKNDLFNEEKDISAHSTEKDENFKYLLIKRLTAVEEQCQKQKQELADNEKQIIHLQKDTKDKQDMINKQIEIAKEKNLEYREIINLNKIYRSQINEMEAFLNDYGLIWVGNNSQMPIEEKDFNEVLKMDENESKLLQEKEKEKEIIKMDEKKDIFFDYDGLVYYLKELNNLADEGKMIIKANTGTRIHKFEEKNDNIIFTLFKNGFMLRRGPFREFTDSTSISFIQDIMDGFFPIELKESFPDGVIFNILDKRNEVYSLNIYNKNKHPPSLSTHGSSKIHLSPKEFLERLPTSVITDGKVICVRDDIEEILGLKKKNDKDNKKYVNIITPPNIKALNEKIDNDLTHSVPQDNNNTKISILQIRSDDGSQTIVLKMPYTNTIRQLREIIDHNRRKDDKINYELRTSFPTKIYSDENITLLDAGLVPNATLFLKHIK